MTNKPYGAVKHAYDEKNPQNNSKTNDTQLTSEKMDEDSQGNDTTFVPTENLKLPVGMLTVRNFTVGLKRLNGKAELC